jgi:hypothetical protein
VKTFLSIFFCLILISCNNGVSTDKHLLGQEEAHVLSSMGKPTFENLFALNKHTLTEMRYGLADLVPHDSTLRQEIKELTWKHRYRTTVVWFKEEKGSWVSVDNITYGNNVKF